MSTDAPNASPQRFAPALRAPTLIAGAALWLAVPVAGFAMLLSHQYAAGEHGSSTATKAGLEAVGVTSDRPLHLVVTLHPHCPCSNTTLEELRSLLSETTTSVRATALFVLPSGVAAEGDAQATAWTEESASWKRAATIPGLERRLIAETDARDIGPRTSGHVLLFHANGTLLFDGGITLGRGHAGDNDGRRALASALRSGQPSAMSHPVYGCRLFDEPAAAAKPSTADEPSCCANHEAD